MGRLLAVLIRLYSFRFDEVRLDRIGLLCKCLLLYTIKENRLNRNSNNNNNTTTTQAATRVARQACMKLVDIRLVQLIAGADQPNSIDNVKRLEKAKWN